MPDGSEFLACLMAAVAMAIALPIFITAGNYPAAIRRSMLAYALAKVAVSVALLLAAGRPAFLGVHMASITHSLTLLAAFLNMTAVRRLQAKPDLLVPGLAATLLLWLGLEGVLFLSADAGRPVRAVATGAIGLVLGVLARELLLRFKGRGKAHLVCGGATAVLCAALLVRLVALLSGQSPAMDSFPDSGVDRTVLVVSLMVSLTSAISFTLMISDAFNRDLSILVQTDDLTGLHNRRHLLTQAEQAVRQARRDQRPLSCLVIDIDHFKRVNDSFGHPVGDQVIQSVGAVCLDQVRATDCVGRLGGEEFAILLPGTDATTALEVAGRLRAAVAALTLTTETGIPVPVTCSIGCASLSDDHQRFQDLLAAADAALYGAKRAGRNCVQAHAG